MDVMPTADGSPPKIKAGTLAKLVENLTHEKSHANDEAIIHFLLTYKFGPYLPIMIFSLPF